MPHLRSMRSALIAVTASTFLLPACLAAQAAASKPDTTAPVTRQDQTAALKSEEKANKQRAKAAHEQRKALRAQDKADKADKKAAAVAPQPK